MFALASWFSSGASLEVTIDTEPNRKTLLIPKGIGDGQSSKALIFTDGEDVGGTATLTLQPGKRLDHFGIKVELVGQMEFPFDKSQSNDFFTISKDLEPPGSLLESKQYKWKFNAVDKTVETYWGSSAKVRYFVRVSVLRQYASHISKEVDFAVQNLYPPPDTLPVGIKMEVGIEDCLHIEFEYDKSQYHTKDVVVGKVFFLLVKIKIKHMQLDIVRKEIIGNSGTGESETVAKFEVMDGAPVKNECIPVRLYLGAYDLSPSYKNAGNKFSVRYFLNLVLLDEEDRRYFKQQEITLWRKKIA